MTNVGQRRRFAAVIGLACAAVLGFALLDGTAAAASPPVGPIRGADSPKAIKDWYIVVLKDNSVKDNSPKESFLKTRDGIRSEDVANEIAVARGFKVIIQPDSVAAGVSPAVEGGILPPGLGSQVSRPRTERSLAPPGGTPASKAGCRIIFSAGI